MSRFRLAGQAANLHGKNFYVGHYTRDADFLLFSLFSVIFLVFCYFPFFSVIFGPIRSLFLARSVLYFLLFHLSLSELSVSFCVHFL